MLRTLPRPGFVTPFRGSQRPLWPFAVNRDSPQAEGLAAWWPMLPSIDPTIIRDIVGLGADGTLVNGPTWDSDASPSTEPVGWALDFAALSSQYISGNWSTSLTATPITVTGWFRISFGTDFPRIFDFADASNSIQLAWDAAAAGGASNLLCTKHTSYQGGVSATQWGSSAPTLGQWYHFAAVFDATGAGVSAFYLNGVSQSGAANSDVGAAGSASAYTFGIRRDLNGSTPLGGSLTDFRFYTRALLAEEVAEMYDPRTRWELYYPLHRRTWGMPGPAGGRAVVGRDGGVVGRSGGVVGRGSVVVAGGR